MITWEDVRMAQMNWKIQRQTQYRASEKPLDRELPPKRLQPHPRFVQDDLPYFQQQDEKEAFLRHKQSMAKRWFGYYRKCKGNRNAIIDQYNRIALMGKER